MIRFSMLAIAAAFSATSVQGATIDFNTQALDGFGSQKYKFNEDGFQVQIVPTSIFGMYLLNDPSKHLGMCNPSCPSNGTTAYYGLNETSVSFFGVNGGLFSLISLDAAQTFTGSGNPLTLTVTGVKAGAVITATIFADPQAAETFSTFALNDFVNLSSLTITGGPEFAQFALDNVVLSAGAVPEPASWALMIAGVGATGGALRRRRPVRTTVSFA